MAKQPETTAPAVTEQPDAEYIWKTFPVNQANPNDKTVEIVVNGKSTIFPRGKKSRLTMQQFEAAHAAGKAMY